MPPARGSPTTTTKVSPSRNGLRRPSLCAPIPTGGRGTAYDWHAVMVMFYRAPKGKLDANDRLFKLIASTIRPEPEWQKMEQRGYRRSVSKEAAGAGEAVGDNRAVSAPRRADHQRRRREQ